jgi:hypothetical protein
MHAGNKLMKSVNDTGIESIIFDPSAKKAKRSKNPHRPLHSRSISKTGSHSDLESIASSDHLDDNSSILSNQHSSMTQLAKTQSAESLSIPIETIQEILNEDDSKMPTSNYVPLATSPEPSSDEYQHNNSHDDVQNPMHQRVHEEEQPIHHEKSSKSLRTILKTPKMKAKVHLLNPRARNVVNRARNVGQQGFQQAKLAGV